jgi:DNA-binding MarR family transcriptional regulator
MVHVDTEAKPAADAHRSDQVCAGGRGAHGGRLIQMSPRPELLEQILRAGREYSDATVVFHAALADRLSLHPTDYKALGILDRIGPMSAGELARHTGLATASVTNLIERLSARGFLLRDTDPRDRRRVLLRATIGDSPDADFLASWQSSSERMWDRYTDAELAVILDFLTDTTSRIRTRTASIDAPGRQ